MQNRKNKSIIWNISKDVLEKLVKKYDSFGDILREIGIRAAGGNYRTLKRVLDKYAIDYKHIRKGLNWNKGLKLKSTSKLTNEELFKTNCIHSRSSIKKRILRDKLIEYKCEQCGQGPIWNNKELVLVLDHINGIYNDNRLENLRFLCPNCNAQQETFCGKHNKHK